MIREVTLRPVEDADFDDLFEFMRDPESVAMAAFTHENPDDRPAFDAWLSRNLSNPETTNLVIVGDGRVVGSIASFVIEGDTEITYWVDRAVWGQGVAGRAVALLLELVTVRPLHARAASDNTGSLRVLTRAGFQVVGTDVGYAAARRAETEETILVLS
ncbi:GNAT family N-acetyltransferase [Lentzea sp. NPDC055074]